MHIDRPSVDELAHWGFPGVDGELLPLIDEVLQAYEVIDDFADDPPDRGPMAYSVDDAGNGWVLRARVSGTGCGPLSGRTVAVKDSIMVAGLPMSAGARVLDGYVPLQDATIVRRVLDAGGTIVGKTNCEYLCLSGGSHTSDYGVTHNPRLHGYSSGGSSSGNAVAIVNGEADLALGTDQAGSIRVPASYSGLVGLKATHGLVPYTGIAPLDPVIDHAGPMTSTVADCALLLGVIAGYDEFDPRQRQVVVHDYLSALDRSPAGLRVGVLREGFSDGAASVVVREAATDLGQLGVKVSEVSVPLHSRSLAFWTPLVMQGVRDLIVNGQGFGSGRADKYPLDLMQCLYDRRDRFGEFPPHVLLCVLVAETAARRRGAIPYAAAINAARQLRAAYDSALTEFDALLMPTTVGTAPRLPSPDDPLAVQVRATNDMFGNTAAFNATGHPALSLPCGMVDGLPVGMMLVGRHHDESTLFRIAHAYESR